MNLNDTIKTQLNHRSIRHFKNQQLDKETLNTLYEVANHTASSQFLQQFSIIHVTDKNKRTKLAEICNQPPVSENGELFIFLIDLHRNVKLRQEANLDDGRLHTMDLYLQGLSDATLAVQNMYLAAESLGLGGVILGSIRNDIRAVSELFNLHDMVIPALGLQIGIPDEEIQQKRRPARRTVGVLARPPAAVLHPFIPAGADVVVVFLRHHPQWRRLALLYGA